MAKYRTQRVVDIIESTTDLIKVRLDDDSRAYAFPQLNGLVAVGDDVVINTTAVDLELGTGGWHFILWNESRSSVETPRGGHIMKLRYTPLQLDTGVAEEFEDWDHTKISLEQMPVIAAPLHSHIPAITTLLTKANADIKIAVLISDGASLPVAMSDTLRQLKELGHINSTISFGHAFGGDIESINVYTALLAAKHKVGADLAIVSMGPGIVGTNSQYGFTGIEVAHHLDVAGRLGGQTFGVLRASSADPRDRHQAISHHSITTYSSATERPHSLGLVSDHELSPRMKEQIVESRIDILHDVIEVESVGIVDAMSKVGLNISSMGRSASEDELFFESAAASAQLVVRAGII